MRLSLDTSFLAGFVIGGACATIIWKKAHQMNQEPFKRASFRVLPACIAVIGFIVAFRIQLPTATKGDIDVKGRTNETSISCKWSPNKNEGLAPPSNDSQKCLDILHERIPPHKRQPRRWLFFGDSTMMRLFHRSDLSNNLVASPLKMLSINKNCYSHITCQHMQGQRCKLNELFDLPYPEHWIPPNRTDLHGLDFTGPVVFGASNPFCTDCSGCDSKFLKCNNIMKNVSMTEVSCEREKNQKELLFRYGGYIAMEFAQDTEIQTAEYLTTQENVANYIHTVWNTLDMVEEYGKPLCVSSAGIHDVQINGIQENDYVRNVKFMLKQLTAVCDHIIWLGNTAPKTDEYNQTRSIMKAWDNAVRDLIASEPKFSFVDVHDASLTWQHEDNIHMNNKWYQLLGNNLFLKLIQSSDGKDNEG